MVSYRNCCVALVGLGLVACAGTPAKGTVAASAAESGCPVSVAPEVAPPALISPQSLAPTTWIVLGPFTSPLAGDGKTRQGMAQDLLTSLGGEAAAVLTAESRVTWQGKTHVAKPALADKAGVVDLLPLYQGDSDMKVAYAYAEVTIGAVARALALLGSDDAAAVWVNGKEVHRAIIDRAVNPDDDRFQIPLIQGKNRILLKVDNGGGGWGFALRLYDEAAKRQLDLLELRRHLERVELAALDRSFFIKGVFPELSFSHPLGAERVLSTPKVRWFDPTLNEVTEPGSNGRYIALVEATTLDHARYRRLVTFAKLPSERILPWVPYEPFGLPPVVELPWGKPMSRAEQQELGRQMWRATQDSFWTDEGGAITALALSELDPKTPKDQPLSWLESGLIKDARHKLALRMKVEGREAKAFTPPLSLKEAAGALKPGSETQAGMKAGTTQQLRALFRDWAKADENGFVVLLARKGVVFMHEAFNGFNKDSLFRPASIAKSIVGLTFARAVDQGLLRFDQPLSEVFPSYSRGNSSTLTFRHCFYHLAGLQKHFSHGGFFNAFLENDLLIQDLAFTEPGTRFSYSGDDLNLAGAALSVVTGRTTFDLLHEHLMAPFGEPVVQLDGGSGTRFSAMYLAKVGQMIVQDGKYGQKQFYSPGFLREVLPKNAAQYAPELSDKKLESGIGLTWMPNPSGPREQGVLGPNVVGHGAASGIFWRIALDQELVAVVGRSEFQGGWSANEAWGDRLAVKLAENIFVK